MKPLYKKQELLASGFSFEENQLGTIQSAKKPHSKAGPHLMEHNVLSVYVGNISLVTLILATLPQFMPVHNSYGIYSQLPALT